MPRITERGVYLGIDPGKSGGIAVLGMVEPRLIPIPESYLDLWGIVAGVNAEFAVLEKVGGFIQGNKLPGSAMFNFGAGFGALEAFLIASRTSYELITPQKWQKALGIPTSGGDKAKHKKKLRDFADRLFPGVKGLTQKTCDAILIAEFARRYREGRLG